MPWKPIKLHKPLGLQWTDGMLNQSFKAVVLICIQRRVIYDSLDTVNVWYITMYCKILQGYRKSRFCAFTSGLFHWKTKLWLVADYLFSKRITMINQHYHHFQENIYYVFSSRLTNAITVLGEPLIQRSTRGSSNPLAKIFFDPGSRRFQYQKMKIHIIHINQNEG